MVARFTAIFAANPCVAEKQGVISAKAAGNHALHSRIARMAKFEVERREAVAAARGSASPARAVARANGRTWFSASSRGHADDAHFGRDQIQRDRRGAFGCG